LVVVLVAMLATGFLSLRVLLQAALTAGVFLLVIAGLPLLKGAGAISQPGGQFPLGLVGFSPETSLAQRWDTIVGGFALFMNNPIFGAGLGAYMEAQVKAGEPLSIHSTPVWLLAETGIVGFAALALPVIRLWYREVITLREEVGAFLVLSILGFAVASSVHELLYQRAFWLLLGAAAACLPSGQMQEPPSALRRG
jgi:hypothetical protein